MKNLTFIAVLALLVGLMGSPALGVEYGMDFIRTRQSGRCCGKPEDL